MPSGKPHRLDPLLNPGSIAIVGARAQSGTSGNNVMRTCLGGFLSSPSSDGFSGPVFLVNPSSDEIDGRPCYPSLLDVPEKIDVAALVVGNNRIEQVFKDVVDAGVRAAVVYGSCLVQEEAGAGQPSLSDRIRQMAVDNGIELCGFNCAGFMNRESGTSLQLQPLGTKDLGSVCLLSQSGSIYAAMVHNGGRLHYNLSVSTGQETVTELTDYMDYALEMESTRTIGLFIETIRNPAAFVAALEKAAERDIAVVALKVARTEISKRFAMSHSGAIAGDDAGFDAVFRRYGVLRVNDPDEMIATLQLLDCGKRAGQGGMVAIADSGGERELLTDVATDAGVPLAEINDATRQRIAQEVEFGVEADNPLDAWNSGHDFARVFQNSMQALMKDPEAAIGIWIADLHDDLDHFWQYAKGAIAIASDTDIPLAIVTCYSKTENNGLTRELMQTGVPVLEGIRPAMTAVRRLLDYRDFCAQRTRGQSLPGKAMKEAAVRWRERLEGATLLSNVDSFALLGDFAIPVVRTHTARSAEDAIKVAHDIGFPVALKTARDDIQHKSDVGGVALNLADETAVAKAYKRISQNLGADVVVSNMVSEGCELAFGLVHDELFGPLAMVSAGGVFIEQFRDAVFAVAPFDSDTARDLSDSLSIRPVLDGVRGAPPCDMAALAQAFSNFSHLVALLGDALQELDINPVIAGQHGVMAVDALIQAANTNETA